MSRNGRSIAALFLFPLMAGCSHLCSSPLAPRLASQSADAKDHVYVVFVDSPVDIRQWGGLPQLKDYLRRCGVSHAAYHNPYLEGFDASPLTDRVRKIRQQDPQARVMLVGWSFGAVTVRGSIGQLAEEGLCVDTVVYLDSWCMYLYGKIPQPKTVGRTVLVYREGKKIPDGFPGAAVHKIDVHHHLNMPKQQHAVDVLFAEVIRLVNCADTSTANLAESLPRRTGVGRLGPVPTIQNRPQPEVNSSRRSAAAAEVPPPVPAPEP